MLSLESLCQRLAAPLPAVFQLPGVDIAFLTATQNPRMRGYSVVLSGPALDDVPGGLLVSDQLKGCLAG